MLLLQHLWCIKDSYITTIRVIFRNLSFLAHKIFRLGTARKNYLLWSFESEKADEPDAQRPGQFFETRRYEQFWERSYHGFWPYFCRTFYDYFAPKPIHISAVWRVSRDDYQNSRSLFYRSITRLINFFKKSYTLGANLNKPYTKYRYRKMAFRLLFLPTVILTVSGCMLIAIKKNLQIWYNAQVIERLPNSWKKSKGLFMFIYTSIFLIITLMSLYSFNTVVPIWFITNLAICMPMALLWQTFMFFYKTYQISKYTTQNQRFWKRSLTLFWLIEGFLFAIVVFIWFISPDNLKYGINHQEVLLDRLFDPAYFISTTLNLALVLVATRILLFYKTTNNRLLYDLLMLVLIYLLVNTLSNELGQLVNLLTKSSTLSSQKKLNMIGLNVVENFSIISTAHESTVYDQVKFLIIFIKFWHVLFIVIYVVFNTFRGIESALSFDSFSSISLNCNYLFIFNLTSIVFFSKHNFYFLINSPTYHYFISNKIGYLYYILNNAVFILKQIPMNILDMIV